MNRRIQIQKDDFGAYYPFNIASETELPPLDKTAVYREIQRVHRLTRADISGGFVFVGFDFILDVCGAPYLIEANVKPSSRFQIIDEATFPSPIVRDMAHRAITSLPVILSGDDSSHWLRVDNLAF